MAEEFNLTPAQSGLCDEHEALPMRQTEDGSILARKDTGVVIQISPEGDLRELSPSDIPPPVELTEGEASSAPSPATAPEDVADADEFKPPEGDLLVLDPTDRGDIARAMDRHDEVAILDEIQGRALRSWVYSFSQRGSLVTDLTVYGVNETVRLLNERGSTQIGISSQPPLVDESVEPDGARYYRVMVYALDARQGGAGRWGTAIEPKMMRKTSGDEVWDKFALTKALNKAQRNALKQLIPEDFRQTVIAQALGEGRVQHLTPIGSGNVSELPPPLDDERAQALKREIHDAYKQLKEVNRLAMPPGRFNSFLTKAETESHDRLEVFRDHILEMVEGEKKKKEAEAGS